VFALCRCISRRNIPPRFVALVPQKEELDEGKVQISASGETQLGSTKEASTPELLFEISTAVFGISFFKR